MSEGDTVTQTISRPRIAEVEPMLLGGDWTAGTGEVVPVLDPATEEVLTRTGRAGPSEVDASCRPRARTLGTCSTTVSSVSDGHVPVAAQSAVPVLLNLATKTSAPPLLVSLRLPKLAFVLMQSPVT